VFGPHVEIVEAFLPGAPGLALFETWDSTVVSILGSCLTGY
jgi:hypothetical protein